MTDSIELGSRGAEMACRNAHAGDQNQPSIETIIESMKERSKAHRQALLDALQDSDAGGPGTGPVSELELSITENKRQGPLDPDPPPRIPRGIL